MALTSVSHSRRSSLRGWGGVRALPGGTPQHAFGSMGPCVFSYSKEGGTSSIHLYRSNGAGAPERSWCGSPPRASSTSVLTNPGHSLRSSAAVIGSRTRSLPTRALSSLFPLVVLRSSTTLPSSSSSSTRTFPSGDASALLLARSISTLISRKLTTCSAVMRMSSSNAAKKSYSASLSLTTKRCCLDNPCGASSTVGSTRFNSPLCFLT
mmetsp:Transcript_33234/g.60979  ORF Transcript_33234/g.60979 Transcript_33234/m.60979 type:complete len:209 (+) Transcript_33234:754-1380(+)